MLDVWADNSSSGSGMLFLSRCFLQMIRADFSMTIPMAWQEHHNIIGLKQALKAERLALFLFFLALFDCNSIITHIAEQRHKEENT